MQNKPVSFNVRLNDPTKAQEIELLEKFFTAFEGSGTYLEMLFTENMVGWVSQMIRNDFSPDMLKDYKETMDVLDRATATADGLKEEQASMVKRYSELKEEYTSQFNECIAEKTEIAEKLVDQTEQLEEMHKYSSKLNKQLRDKGEKLNSQEWQLMRLKARLFDLEFALSEKNEKPEA